MKLLYSGKVRDVYRDGSDIVLVASDRVSVYDVVLPTPIPDKGALLTQLSLWWFEQLADVVPNHVISTDVPSEFAGRAIRCRPLEIVQVECIARGYLTGLGLREYQRTGAVAGVALPPGLVEGSRLPEPIFTPTTKEPVGRHDEFITYPEVIERVGADTAERLRELTVRLYRRSAERAAKEGLIIADTKFEFGYPGNETAGSARSLVLGDEVLTSDSSRYWPADGWAPGRPRSSFDKQIVRDWAAGTGWDKTPPGPEIPPDVVALTRSRYVELYERLTGLRW